MAYSMPARMAFLPSRDVIGLFLVDKRFRATRGPVFEGALFGVGLKGNQ